MKKTPPWLRDAGKILLFLSEKFSEDSQIKMRCIHISNELNWDLKRVKRAVRFLHGTSFTESRWIETHDFMITGLTSSGNSIVRNEEEFREYFGFFKT